MNHFFTFSLFSLLTLQTLSQNAIDSLIFSDPSNKLVFVKAIKSHGDTIKGESLNDHQLSRNLTKELSHPFFQSLIKLNQCSRNLSKNLEGPNVLLLSEQQGGFARTGLQLNTKKSQAYFPKLHYVDLVVSEQGISTGDLDLFPHELGHVMMRNIWPNFSTDNEYFDSPKMHMSMGIIDYKVAIIEGFGIHFQRLTLDHHSKYKTIHEAKYVDAENSAGLWHSSHDADLRINGVLTNKFIHEKQIPNGWKDSINESEHLILRYDASPIFDPTTLKNAQQMLSSEGVLATLFYKITTNQSLQNNYQSESFYSPFLIHPSDKTIEAKVLFTPFENVMLKHFWVWHKLNELDLENKQPMIAYINTWMTEFPEDKEEVLRVFIATTIGKTISNGLGNLYVKMSKEGMIGDYSNYASTRKAYQDELNKLVNRVLNNEASLVANIGPEIWVVNPNFKIRKVLWMPEPKEELRININTASLYDLLTFKGIDYQMAKKIIDERSQFSFFGSLKELEFLGVSKGTFQKME